MSVQINITLPDGLANIFHKTREQLGFSQSDFGKIAIMEYLRSLGVLNQK